MEAHMESVEGSFVRRGRGFNKTEVAFDPVPPRREVAFDTSSLSELVEPGFVEEVCAIVRERDLHVLVPLPAIAELADDDDQRARRSRLETLWGMMDLLGSRARVGADTVPLLRVERWSDRSPASALLPPWRVPALRALEAHQGSRPAWVAPYLNKEWTVDLDRRAESAFDERELDPSPNDTDTMMLDLRGAVLTSDPSSFALPFVVRNDARYQKRVARSPERYPATLLAAGLAQLHALSALFARVGYGRWTSVLKRPRRGDWVDMRIAIGAACADVLVTDDDVLRARVNHLRKHLGTRPEAMTLRDWAFDM